VHIGFPVAGLTLVWMFDDVVAWMVVSAVFDGFW
jgi:hypothetical protein